MTILDRLNLFIEIYFQIFKSLRSIGLLLPFLIIALLQAGWLAVLINFYYPPITSFLLPLLRHFFSSRALHFPYFYYILPKIYNYGDIMVIDLFFGIILTAAAVFMIGVSYQQERGGFIEGVRTAFKSLPSLVAVWLIKTAVLLLVFAFVGGKIFLILKDYPMSYFNSFFIIQMLAVIVSAFFVYAYPAIILHRRGLLRALGESISLTFKHFVFTFFLLFIPWFLLFPLKYLTTTKAYLILGKFSYTTLVFMLGANIVLGLAAGYLLYAGITYFYLNLTE